jgi:hypothetical protein
LLDRERFGGRGSEGTGHPFRCPALGGLAAVRFSFGGFGGEVEAGLFAGAGADNVPPLLERTLVVEENEGALEGRALGAVARECVPVLEVLGRVPPVDISERAAVGA